VQLMLLMLEINRMHNFMFHAVYEFKENKKDIKIDKNGKNAYDTNSQYENDIKVKEASGTSIKKDTEIECQSNYGNEPLDLIALSSV